MSCHRPPRRGPRAAALAGLLAITGAGPVRGDDASLRLDAEEVTWGENLRLRGIEAVLHPAAGRARVTIESLVLGELRLEALAVDCERFAGDAREVRCRGGLAFDHGMPRRRWQAALDAGYRSGDAAFDAALDLGPQGWPLRLTLAGTGRALEGTAEWSGLQLPELPLLATAPVALEAGRSSGRASFALARGRWTAAGELCGSGIDFDSEDGTLAAAGLGACLRLSGRGEGAALDFDAVLAEPPSGELLAGSLYLDFATIAPEFEVEGSVAGDRLEQVRARLADPAVGTLEVLGAAALDDLAAGRWTVRSEGIDLAGLLAAYLRPVLAAAGIGRLEATGRIAGELALEAGRPGRARATLAGVSLRDRDGRFAVRGLGGELLLGSAPGGARSTIAWEGARLYALPLGGATAELSIHPDGFALLGPLPLPVLDGGLELQTFEVTDLAAGSPDFAVQAEIRPISLEAFTGALGWPPLRGRIAGQIPRVDLRDGVLEVDGRIAIEVFDGRLLAGKLRVERLFGTLPTLAADLSFRGLDLQQLTGAFAFGEITGTLDGRMDGLRLLDWEPVAFDLELRSPAADRRPRRISQRAVDNLTRIGGGPSAVLSSTFLRFFETFTYASIGLSCRLQDDICRMGGVEPAPNGGYYIVKGSGIPRIDVIGYARRVDFPELRRRLAAATTGGPPVVD